MLQQSLQETTWFPFNNDYVDGVLNQPGVYWLGINNGIIYIGKSENLRTRLMQHLSTVDACIKNATQFAFERSSNPAGREAQLLEDYRRQHGQLPRCNDRLS